MKQEDLLKKTGVILNELQEQYDFMMQDPQQISDLELELFLANAKFLAEHVQILKKISNFQPVKALPEHAQTTSSEDSNVGPTQVFDDFFTPDKETPTFEFLVNDRQDKPHFVAESSSQIINPDEPAQDDDDDYPERELYEIEEPVEEPFQDTPVEEPVEEPKPSSRHVHPVYSNMDIGSIPPEQIAHDVPVNDVEEQEEEDEVGPEPFLVDVSIAPPPVPAPTPAPTPVAAAAPEPIIPIVTAAPEVSRHEAAATQAHQPTLNELLAAGKLGSNSTVQREPESAKPAITDLKRAISLNEKLLFVKDLFDGYNLAYAEAIDLINKMPDYDTADAFLQKHYAGKHNWAAKQGTVDQFYELLHQRFAK